MSDQPETLQGVQSDFNACMFRETCRRQHARIEADEALMRQALNLLSSLPWNEGYADDTDSAITALRKRLESSNAS